MVKIVFIIECSIHCCITASHLSLFFSLSLSLSPSGLQFEFINPIFEFSKGMNDLQLDEAEYALLIAINIFSAGQNLRIIYVLIIGCFSTCFKISVYVCVCYFVCLFVFGKIAQMFKIMIW